MNVPSSSTRQGRIPFTLQAVFLASNRGNEVHKPPPEKVASKVFFRNWLFQRQSNSGNNKRSLFSLMKKDTKDVTEVAKEAEASPAERRNSAMSNHVSQIRGSDTSCLVCFLTDTPIAPFFTLSSWTRKSISMPCYDRGDIRPSDTIA